MQTQSIPEPIANAAASMLAPYCPGLTAAKLEAAITYEPEKEQAERLRTRKEASAALNISIVTLDRMLTSGEMPRRRIRGSVRVPQSAIDRILAGEAA